MQTQFGNLVAKLVTTCNQLNALYPQRKFSLDGHLIGSIGDVIAAQTFGLNLVPQNTKGHDATTRTCRKVEIKSTTRNSIAFQAAGSKARYLIVVEPISGSIIWHGSYRKAFNAAGPTQKNGQCRLGIAALAKLRQEPIR